MKKFYTYFASALCVLGTVTFAIAGRPSLEVTENERPQVSATETGISYDGLIYSVDTEAKTATVTKAETSTTNANIPETISYQNEEYTVTSIGTEAFKQNTTIKSVTIPATITSIGNYAFQNAALESLYISDLAAYCGITVSTSTGSSPFYALCSSTSSSSWGKLYINNQETTDIVIPEGVKTIGQSTFHTARLLTSIQLPEGLETIETAAFYSTASLQTITLPESLTTLGDQAFYGSGLTSIIVPSNVKSLGTNLFKLCSNLNNVILPEGITTIPERCFDQCKALKSINLPSTLTSLSNYSFYQCTALTDIVIPEGVTTIGQNSFQSCTALSTITLPSTLTSIGATTFNMTPPRVNAVYCAASTPPSVGNNGFVTGIKNNATLYVPEDAVSQYKAQWGFSTVKAWEATETPTVGNIYYKLNNEDMTAQVTGCDASLTDLNIPASITCATGGYAVTSIAADAFKGANSSSIRTFNSVTIPASITSIGRYAFQYVDIKTLYINDLAKWCAINFNGSSYSNPFMGLCRQAAANTWGKLYINGIETTDIVIPAGVTEISDYAFNPLKTMTSVTLPAGVSKIGSYTFQNCTSLTTAELPATLTSLGESVFASSGITSITVPGSVTAIPAAGFNNCKSLSTIVLEEGVTSIGGTAFAGCSALVNITLPSTLKSVQTQGFNTASTLIKSITCSAMTPPSLTAAQGGVFAQTVYNNATLYVPYRAINDYKGATYWQEFKKIEAIPGTDLNEPSEGDYVIYQNGTIAEGLTATDVSNATWNLNATNPGVEGTVFEVKPSSGSDYNNAAMGFATNNAEIMGPLNTATLCFNYYATVAGTYTVRLTGAGDKNYNFTVPADGINKWTPVSFSIPDTFPELSAAWKDMTYTGDVYPFSIVISLPEDTNNANTAIYFNAIYYTGIDTEWEAPESVVPKTLYMLVNTGNENWNPSMAIEMEGSEGVFILSNYKFESAEYDTSAFFSFSTEAGTADSGMSSLGIRYGASSQDCLIEPDAKQNLVISDNNYSFMITPGVYDVKVEFDEDGNGTVEVFQNGDSSRIENMTTNTESTYYTIQGVRVQNPDKGLYIKVENGKSVKILK